MSRPRRIFSFSTRKRRLKPRRLQFLTDPAYITALAALIIPGTAAIHGFFNTQLEIKKHQHQFELSQEGQTHKIRQTYLDRAVDPQRNAQYRASILNFLLITLDDDDMTRWAQGELDELQNVLNTQPQLANALRELEIWTGVLKSYEEGQEQPPNYLVEKSAGAQQKVDDFYKTLKSAEENADLPLPPAPNVYGESGDRCCVTCEGYTICAASVNTACGSCSA